MTAIEQIIAIAEQLGWQVKTDTDKPNLVVFDFQQYTPHGQDFSFSVEMKGNDTDSLLQEVETYYWKISTKVSTPTMKPTCGLVRTGMARTAHLTESKTS